MHKKIIKKIEQQGKKVIEKIFLIFISKKNNSIPQLEKIKKVLVFRLDERIGNGILLLPLLNSIRCSLPHSRIDFLIHKPVAELFIVSTGDLLSNIILYDQPLFFKKPWRMVKLVLNLRRANYDIIITSHNYDNFSISQALFGRLCNGNCLVGFKWRDSDKFYDIAIKITEEKQYSAAMTDLWKIFDHNSKFKLGGLIAFRNQIQSEQKNKKNDQVLLWLGAGKGGDKNIPPKVLDFILSVIEETGMTVKIATGVSDLDQLVVYSQEIISKTLVWNKDLVETAKFFSRYQIFISGDTGPMHLAVALGLSTLGIFLHTNMIRYGYHDEKNHFSLKWGNNDTGYELLNLYITKLVNRVTYSKLKK
jgi:heptosyltransferase-3